MCLQMQRALKSTITASGIVSVSSGNGGKDLMCVLCMVNLNKNVRVDTDHGSKPWLYSDLNVLYCFVLEVHNSFKSPQILVDHLTVNRKERRYMKGTHKSKIVEKSVYKYSTFAGSHYMMVIFVCCRVPGHPVGPAGTRRRSGGSAERLHHAVWRRTRQRKLYRQREHAHR